jgi:hypothetical protein
MVRSGTAFSAAEGVRSIEFALSAIEHSIGTDPETADDAAAQLRDLISQIEEVIENITVHSDRNVMSVASQPSVLALFAEEDEGLDAAPAMDTTPAKPSIAKRVADTINYEFHQLDNLMFHGGDIAELPEAVAEPVITAESAGKIGVRQIVVAPAPAAATLTTLQTSPARRSTMPGSYTASFKNKVSSVSNKVRKASKSKVAPLKKQGSSIKAPSVISPTSLSRMHGAQRPGKFAWLRRSSTETRQDTTPKNRNDSDDDDDLSESEKHPYIIRPEGYFRTRWDLIMMVLIVYYAITVPIQMGFNPTQANAEKVFDNVANIMFIIDIFLNFRTGFTIGGDMVLDPDVISRRYLKGWFFIDVVASVPIGLLLQGGENLQFNKLFRLMRIFKLLRLFRMSRIMEHLEAGSLMNPGVMRLMKLLVSMIVLWHWIACTYWFISEWENFAKDSPVYSREGSDWLKGDGDYVQSNYWVPPVEIWCRSLEECTELLGPAPRCVNHSCPASVLDRYWTSLFWAVMVTIGIGRDVMPVTNLEHNFSIIVMIIGVIMYAGLIGSTSSALADIDREKAAQKRRLEHIKNYMNKRQVPHDLQLRIRRFYEYMWASNSTLGDESDVMEDLHSLLKLELAVATNLKLVRTIPLFRNISSPNCLVAIVQNLRPRIAIPGEYILVEGDEADSMFILVKGNVRVYSKGAKKKFRRAVLKSGHVFGEQALLEREKKRDMSARALSYCDLLTLTQEDFYRVFRHYPEFLASLQRQMARNAKNGWDKVRHVVSSARALKKLGAKIDMEEMLQGARQVRHLGTSARMALIRRRLSRNMDTEEHTTFDGKSLQSDLNRPSRSMSVDTGNMKLKDRVKTGLERSLKRKMSVNGLMNTIRQQPTYAKKMVATYTGADKKMGEMSKKAQDAAIEAELRNFVREDVSVARSAREAAEMADREERKKKRPSS